MPSDILYQFQEPIRTELEQFEVKYKSVLTSGIFVVDRVVNYLSRTHGKGIRPTLTLLCASLGGERPNERTITAAVIIELLHEATLVHDDVVDEADTRRGWPSLPAKFKNKVSVLFGDYMLATVLSETLSARDMEWLDVLSHTSKRMARGELVQAARTHRLDLNETDYLNMIADKTGALFSAGCQLGGLSAGLKQEWIEQIGIFGNSLGIAFQICDDLLDMFGDDTGYGKPLFGDIKERKLTLPLIKALHNSTVREARRIKARIRRGIKKHELNLITDFIKHYNGDTESISKMNEYASNAQMALESLPDSLAKKTLIELIVFTTKRRK